MCVGRGADGCSREYYFSSGRLKVLLLVRRFLCVEALQRNGAPAHMQYFFKNVKQDLPSDGNC